MTLDLSAELGNQANVKIRWRGVKTDTDNYWENWSVDDVKVSASTFSVDFSADPSIGTAPLEVTFTHSTLPPATYTYDWDFGDGDDSSNENPSHTYTTDGVYSVTLSVTNTGTSELVITEKVDYIMVVPFSGAGTQADPFLITSMEDLHALSGIEVIWDKYFELTADIDAESTETDPLYNNGGDGFSPIGSTSKPFKGTFDGKGFAIRNLYINANFNNKGLFGYTSNAQIKNLGVTDAEILGTGAYHGILIGDDEGTSADVHSVIENCYTTGIVSGGSNRTGGFIGFTNRTEIKDSYTISSVNGGNSGGTFVGQTYYAVFDNCYAQGSVYMSQNGEANVGGFIGASYGDKITNCYATAAVTSFAGATNVGGFVGYFASAYGGVFNGCYWDTETTGQATSEGPISDYYKGLTTTEFSDESNFMEDVSTSWDFANTWIMGIISGDNVVRPRLLWQELPTYWTGDVDNDWHDAGNWDLGIPTSSTDVIVPAGLTDYPTISAAAADCYDITLENGATLVGQEYLTASGTTTVEKSITAYSAVDALDGWYGISAPVSAMAIPGSDFEPAEDVDDFYVFDPATNFWLNYYGGNLPGLFDVFDPATGYLVAYASGNAGTKTFTGAFNSAASYQLNPPNTGLSNWSLIGNPYPSKVTWADVTWANVSSPKVINLSTGGWNELGAELEVGQGILIYAEAGSPSIKFELADQTHGAPPAKATDDNSTVKFLANVGDLSVHLLLLANEDASQAYEWNYDARYMAPFTEIPYLCALTTDDVWVSKYAFKPSDETCIIPLYFEVEEEQQITFEIEDYEKSSGINKVTLEDTYLNTFTVLTDGKDYTFTASANDDELRFKLHLESSTGINSTPTIDGLDIYTQNNMLYLNSDKLMDINVQVFNVTGQEVMQRKLLLNGIQQINVTANTGWYMVKVTSTEGIMSRKVFIP